MRIENARSHLKLQIEFARCTPPRPDPARGTCGQFIRQGSQVSSFFTSQLTRYRPLHATPRFLANSRVGDLRLGRSHRIASHRIASHRVVWRAVPAPPQLIRRLAVGRWSLPKLSIRIWIGLSPDTWLHQYVSLGLVR